MPTNRPFVLSIAGFDPSGGAGILADIKSIEQQKSYGLAINTAITLQTENHFAQLDWQRPENILAHLAYMLQHYPIRTVKIGIVESLEVLNHILTSIKTHNPNIKIVWDTVLKSTNGQPFFEAKNNDLLLQNLALIDLITPNLPEVLQLSPSPNPQLSAQTLAQHTAVLLKGGHNEQHAGHDILFLKPKEKYVLLPECQVFHGKHGTGCILSSAIAAHLGQGQDLKDACVLAKKYLEKVANSHPGLLAYHAF